MTGATYSAEYAGLPPPEERIEFLLRRVWVAIEDGAFEICGHQEAVRGRQVIPQMRRVENLAAIEVARKLIETQARINGAIKIEDADRLVREFFGAQERAKVRLVKAIK